MENNKDSLLTILEYLENLISLMNEALDKNDFRSYNMYLFSSKILLDLGEEIIRRSYNPNSA